MDEKILELYEKYETCRQVADELGITNEVVRRTLVRYGVPRTHRHPKEPKTDKRMPSKCRTKYCGALVVMLRTALGMTSHDISQATGIPSASVVNIFNRKRPDLKLRKCQRVPDSTINDIERDYMAGATTYELGEKYGLNHATISNLMIGRGHCRGKGNRLEKAEKRVCRECGKVYTTAYRDKKYCSRACQNAHFSRLRDDKKRVGGNVVHIGLHKLYERDGGICHICGGMTDWDDYRYDERGNFITGRNYPTRDHVVPLAKGGQHTWDNVKLAHFHCNNAKGDKLLEVVSHA